MLVLVLFLRPDRMGRHGCWNVALLICAPGLVDIARWGHWGSGDRLRVTIRVFACVSNDALDHAAVGTLRQPCQDRHA